MFVYPFSSSLPKNRDVESIRSIHLRKRELMVYKYTYQMLHNESGCHHDRDHTAQSGAEIDATEYLSASAKLIRYSVDQ